MARGASKPTTGRVMFRDASIPDRRADERFASPLIYSAGEFGIGAPRLILGGSANVTASATISSRDLSSGPVAGFTSLLSKINHGVSRCVSGGRGAAALLTYRNRRRRGRDASVLSGRCPNSYDSPRPHRRKSHAPELRPPVLCALLEPPHHRPPPLPPTHITSAKLYYFSSDDQRQGRSALLVNLGHGAPHRHDGRIIADMPVRV